MKRSPLKLTLAVLVLAVGPAGALGQSSLDVGELPKSTMFYFDWHGTPSGEARKANSLLALWDDADLALVRAATIEEMMRSSAESQKMKAPLTRDELLQYAALLDNEFVFGYMGNPRASKTNGAAHESQTNKTNKWNGMFLVYDRSGKETTLAKLLLQMRMNEKEPPKISAATIAGISAIKIERKSGTSYWAEEGKYEISASEPMVFEQILKWTKHETPEPARMAKTAAYREAGDLLRGGVADFFFHFTSTQDMDWETSVGGFRLRPLIESLKLDALHSIAGHVVLEGARTRIQCAILGDTRPGSVFDIWDEGTALPSSWQFINANTVSYSESRANLPGIYGLIKRAMQATAGPGQKSPLDFMETAAETRLGMPLPSALAVFSGEFASFQTSPTFDPAKQVYIIGIRKKPEALKLLRAGLAERITDERLEGDTSFLKISEGGHASAAGTASWKYYHAAVTPEEVVISKRYEAVRETVAAGKKAPSENAMVPQSWRAARDQLPKNVNGLGFLDFQKIDWAEAKERWKAESDKASRRAAAKQEIQPDAFTKALKDLDPQVFPRHLHLAASGSWKDAQGVHFDGWID